MEESGNIIISAIDSALYSVTGTGEYFDKAKSVESWIGIGWQSMHLNYSYADGENTYEVTDTIVFRDRRIKMELNKLKIVK